MKRTENEPTFSVVSRETGAIVDNYYPGDVVTVRRETQKEYTKSKIKNFNKGERFVKVFIDVILSIGQQLNNTEFATAIKLCKFVGYETGVLEIDEGNNKYPADLKTLSAELDIKYDQFRKIISSLMKKDIIRKMKRVYGKKEYSCYVANPYVYIQGQNLDRDVYELFKDSVWAQGTEE